MATPPVTSRSPSQKPASSSRRRSTTTEGAQIRSAFSGESVTDSVIADQETPPGLVLVRRTTTTTIEEFVLAGSRGASQLRTPTASSLASHRVPWAPRRRPVPLPLEESEQGPIGENAAQIRSPTVTVSSESASSMDLTDLDAALPTIPEGSEANTQRIRRWNANVAIADDANTDVATVNGNPHHNPPAVPIPAQRHTIYIVPTPEQFVPFPSTQSEGKYYTVTVGQAVGVFDSWHFVAYCVNGISGGTQKSFRTWEEAHARYSNQYNLGMVSRIVVPGSALDFADQANLQPAIPGFLPIPPDEDL